MIRLFQTAYGIFENSNIYRWIFAKNKEGKSQEGCLILMRDKTTEITKWIMQETSQEG